MDVREKLVELIANVKRSMWGKNGLSCELARNMYLAENLIAHGVTMQEWIPVKDMMPEVGGYVVCIAKRNPFSRFMPMVARIEKNGWVNPMTEQYISEVTHWMPLPSTEGLK